MRRGSGTTSCCWRVSRGGATRLTAIRRAVPADAVALAEFGARTFRDAFEADNSSENMALFLASSYGPDLQSAELGNAAIVTLLAECDSRLAGYAQLREGPAPACVDGPRAIELWRFYVERAWQGRGVAQALMAATIEAAATRGAGTVWLCVWERNHRAQAFYRKCGFEDRGQKEFILGNDRQTDRVMARALDASL
jgi:ribosomal protein S18 acetylase RimI-like enzyme